MSLETNISTPPAATGTAGPRGKGSKRLPLAMRLVGTVFGFAGTVAPRPMSSLLRRMLFTPTRLKPKGQARSLLAAARTEEVTIGEFRVFHYWWGGGGPLVLLVHGWSGEAGQMTTFVEPLLAAGYRVLALDLPGHGKSSGRLASVRHFERIFAHIGNTYGKFHGVIAHSLGAAAVTFALSRGFCAERIVFFGPVSRFASIWTYSQRMLNLPKKVMDQVIQRAEEWLEITFDEMEPARLAPSLSAHLLVVHDRGDRESPFEDGTVLVSQWPRARLIATEKLGHTRTLRDADTVRQAVDFVAHSN